MIVVSRWLSRRLSRSYSSKMKLTVFSLLMLIFFTKSIQCAKILALMLAASPSHHIWNSAIAKELARRGHEVTYFSPDKDAKSTPNLRQIQAEDVYKKIYADFNLDEVVEPEVIFDKFRMYADYAYINCKFVIESKGFEELQKIVKKEKFDLIIFEITLGECILPLTDDLKGVPILGVTPYGGNHLQNYLTGNPEMLAIKANTHLQISNNMTFVERLQNVLLYVYVMYDRFYNLLPKQQELATAKFPKSGNVHDVLDRLSLVLTNTHYSIDGAVPAVPGLINVAGLHIKPPKPLPDDLQKYLDESTHGAILFSLGSNLKSTQLSDEKRKILMDAFKELAPVRILWKFEKDDLPGKPENVLIKKWLPQNDILVHPNIKVLFTHSGLLSIQEAFYHGKPIIGMPFFADQFINTKKCVRDGLGERIEFLRLDKNNLTQTIKKVLYDPKYKERAEHISRIFKDRPHTPLETAMFWIEYVIRHKGAPHLRCASLNLSWYQNNLVDVILILTAVTVVVLITIYTILKTVLRCLTGGKTKGKKLKKH